jgi:hypothetical protein
MGAEERGGENRESEKRLVQSWQESNRNWCLGGGTWAAKAAISGLSYRSAEALRHPTN